MGVKSTRTITFEEAFDMYADFKIDRERIRLRCEAMMMSRTDLENILEKLNDERSGGECFRNYSIEGSR